MTPFRAEAQEIRRLRGTVAAQLERWARPSITDEAELIVTELATNVLKHVGAGAAGVLILEARREVLRMEIHDRSYVTPAPAGLACDSECGRGLHLVANMAADWGTVVTASGKAVWCELAVTAMREPHASAHTHAKAPGNGKDAPGPVGGGGNSSPERTPAAAEAPMGLITDLMGWARARYESVPDVT
ncbi:ATP-binding protein [Streptomyces sp. NPDC046939]|uniref:ATP-binding protein n=1 Tax=Streptomyces sp. NPDC046939 TaxID=3155376 RepID=UPI0033CC8B3C